MQIADKKDVDKLVEEFKKLEEVREFKVEFCDVLVLLWWTLFKKYRAVYYMQRCCDGMHHDVAFRQADEFEKDELLLLLKVLNWN